MRRNKKTALVNDTEDPVETSRGLPDLDNPSELLNSSQSPTNISVYKRDLRNSKFDVVDTCDSVDSAQTLSVGEIRDNSCCVGSEFLEIDKASNASQTPPCDQSPNCEITCDSINTNLKSDRSGEHHDRLVNKKVDITSQVKQKNENKEESALRGLDLTSHNSATTKTCCLLKTDKTPDDDLDCANSTSSSCLTDQCETNTIQACGSFELSTKTVKTVLNATELIENEKNLKISSCSNSRSIFQPSAAVIDVTSYSVSDLINNSDSSSLRLGEQQIIANSDLDQNHKLYYSNYPVISNTDPQSKSKSHRTPVTERLSSLQNQTSFELIKDYTLPSTGVTNIVSTSTPDVDLSCVSRKSEGNMSSVEKTREQVKAEREAKKAAKALAKSKAKAPKSEEQADTQTSKDAPTTTDQIPIDKKENTTKTAAVPPEEKTVKREAEVARSTGNKENELDSKVDGKSKREAKAERRAKQEAQRALKEKQIAEKNKPKSSGPPKMKDTPKVSDPVKTTVRKTLVDNNLHEVKLFKHLYHERELSLVNVPILNSNVHPAVVRLGVQYGNKVIVGSNARCVALLAAVKQLIEDFERPSQADFTRGLEASLQECAAYLHHCRPMAVSMQNALRHLKWQMTQLPTTVSDNDVRIC